MKRWFVLVALSATLALGTTVALPPSAARAITPGGAFDPINVLPSTVKGAFSGVGPTQLGAAYQFLYGFLMAPETRAAAAAKAAAPVGAVPTPANAAALATAKSKFRIPVGTAAGFVKGVGPQAVGMVGFEIGTMIGGGVLDVMGIDEAGTVCGTGPLTEGFQNFVTGLDCNAFRALPDYVPNAGLVARPAGWTTNLFGYGWTGTPGAEYWSCNTMGQFTGQNGSMVCTIVKGDRSQDPGVGSSWKLYCQNGTARPELGTVDLRFLRGDGSGTTTAYQGGSFTPGSLSWTCPAGAVPYSFVYQGDYNTNNPAISYNKPPDTGTKGNTSSRPEWYSSASPFRTDYPGTSADPLRHFECVVATAGQSYTAVSAEFHETDADWPTPVCPSLPEGVFPTKTDWYLVGGGERHLLNTETASPEFTSAAATHPECMDGSCILDLLKIGGTVEKSCFDSPADCEGWFESPTKADQYVCRYGTKVVALSECTVYAPAFQPTARETGNSLGDPVTGQPVVNPAPAPGTGAGSDTRTECFPTGWGVLNPFEWVLKPVGCALEAAFVPRSTQSQKAEAALNRAIDNSGLGTASRVLGDMQSAFDLGVSTCTGPPWRFHAFGVDETFYPFNACDEPVKGVASAVNGMIAFAVIFTTVLSALRYIAGTIGFVGLAGNAMHSEAVSDKK